MLLCRTCKSALRSSQAISITLSVEVQSTCSRVDNGRSSDADSFPVVCAKGISSREGRIKSPILNQSTCDSIDDPYNILRGHNDDKLMRRASRSVNQRVGLELLICVVFIFPTFGPTRDLGSIDVVIGKIA